MLIKKSEKENKLLINVWEETIQFTEASSLEEYYKAIKTDIIEMPVYMINKKPYQFVCDEEGLCRSEIKISAVGSNLKPMLVGNLIITGSVDREGNVIPLTSADVKHILKCVGKVSTEKFKNPYPVLSKVDYFYGEENE